VTEDPESKFEPLRNLHSVKILHTKSRHNLESNFELLTKVIKKHYGSIHGCQYIGRTSYSEADFEMAVYYDIPGNKVDAFLKESLDVEARFR